MRKFLVVLPLFLLLLSCGGKKVASKTPASTLDEPDRALFERAKRDLDKNKFTVARLTLQTLINTYPDSDYLPQAKYAMAESFYEENSSSSLNQAENEFKDFITFFPVSPLAADAQMKIAMTHVRRIEKADRDRTQALLAELELRSMIESYPDSNLLNEAKEKLRAVQEVLADGVNRVANQYMLRRNYAAAISRYKEVMTKYPDFSGMPGTLFNLAESLRKSGNEQESAIYFARIITEHPLSERADDAKRKLVAINQPIPEPNPAALERAQQTAQNDRGIFGKMFGMFKSRPNVPQDTAAASSAEEATGATEDSAAPVRGGNPGVATPNSGAGSNSGGTLNVEPAKVDPKASPAKKPR